MYLSHSHLENKSTGYRKGIVTVEFGASGVISAFPSSSPIQVNRPMRNIYEIRSDAPVETAIRPVFEVAIDLADILTRHGKIIAYSRRRQNEMFVLQDHQNAIYFRIRKEESKQCRTVLGTIATCCNWSFRGLHFQQASSR